MAEQGSSHWNGQYGEEEAQRRANYDRAVEGMRKTLTYDAGHGQGGMKANMATAQRISDKVPRGDK